MICFRLVSVVHITQTVYINVSAGEIIIYSDKYYKISHVLAGFVRSSLGLKYDIFSL